MIIQPEVGAESLHHRHRAAARLAEAGLAGEPPVPALDLLPRDASEREHEVVVEREPHPEREGKREHPLPHPLVGEHALTELERLLGHPPATAPRAEPAPVAAEGCHSIEAAALAPVVRAAQAEGPAVEEAPELLHHEAGELVLAQERREVVAEDAMQRPVARVLRARVRSRHERVESSARSGGWERDSHRIRGANWRGGGHRPGEAGARRAAVRARSRSQPAHGAIRAPHVTARRAGRGGGPGGREDRASVDRNRAGWRESDATGLVEARGHRDHRAPRARSGKSPAMVRPATIVASA